MKFKDLEDIVEQYMLLEDKGVLRLICAVLAGNHLPTPPNFLFIVGEPSGGKSMILQNLKPIQGIYELDDMTAQTFASGMRGQSENSLLHQLPLNGCLLIKDYTTMLAKDKESQGAILGQMRKIFDGDYRKKFGNGEEVIWEGKMGMLAGVTPIIYSQEIMSTNAIMGERYLYYRMEMPDRIEVAMRSTDDIKDREAKAAMTKAFDDYLNPVIQKIIDDQRSGNFKTPKLKLEDREKIVHLAEFTTRARSGVKRNMYSRDKDQESKPSFEMPSRFAKALVCVAIGLLILHRYDEEREELTAGDRAIIFKIALDSIPESRRHVLEALTAFSNATEAGLREYMSLSGSYLKIYLNDLVALNVVIRTQASTGGWLYSLRDDYRQLMAKYQGISMKDETLESDIPEEGEFVPPF